MQSRAEQHGLSDEQWGSRRDRTSIDASMIKLLCFDNAHLMKATYVEVNHDMKACFHRMNPSQSNIYAQKLNVDKKLLEARAICIERLKRRVKTGLGVSDTTYQQEEGEPTIGGEVQGKGDVPALFLQQSSALLKAKAHASIAPGLTMESCTGKRSIKRHSVAYVDDTDENVTVDRDSEFPIHQAVRRGQKSAQIWSNLANITGHSMALQKTNWRMIAWELINGSTDSDPCPNNIETEATQCKVILHGWRFIHRLLIRLSIIGKIHDISG
ncbi:hypothetical protein ACHAXR_002471 [Thalassiosira sp. AJA248-18]